MVHGLVNRRRDRKTTISLQKHDGCVQVEQPDDHRYVDHDEKCECVWHDHNHDGVPAIVICQNGGVVALLGSSPHCDGI
jgi:hypothetical protein